MKTIIVFCMICSVHIISASETNGKNKSNANKPNISEGSSSRILGMSVTGNKESPRSLIIVPWRNPVLDDKEPQINTVWTPKLNLLDPESYRRGLKHYLNHRK